MRLDVEHSSIINPVDYQILPLYLETQLPFLVLLSGVEEDGSPGLDDVDLFVGDLDLEEIEGMRQDEEEVVAEGEDHSAVQEERVLELYGEVGDAGVLIVVEELGDFSAVYGDTSHVGRLVDLLLVLEVEHSK